MRKYFFIFRELKEWIKLKSFKNFTTYSVLNYSKNQLREIATFSNKEDFSSYSSSSFI